MRKRLGVIAALAAASVARASITMSLDILDAGDPGGPPPVDRLVVDIFVDVSAQEYFTLGAIRGVTDWGATLIYSEGPIAPFYPPEDSDHHTTFGSAAYERDSAARYAPAGTIAEQGILPAVGYDPPSAFPIFDPNLINVGYFAFPFVSLGHPDAPAGRDGWTLRIALDTTHVKLPGSHDNANYRIFTPGQEPPGYEAIFLSEGGLTDIGTYMEAQSTARAVRNWGVYVPEPSTGILFLLALAVLRIRYR